MARLIVGEDGSPITINRSIRTERGAGQDLGHDAGKNVADRDHGSSAGKV